MLFYDFPNQKKKMNLSNLQAFKLIQKEKPNQSAVL